MTESPAPSPSAAPRPHSKAYRVGAGVLVILASLGVVVSLVGLWVRSTVFDTDAFLEAVETSLSSEEVVSVLGETISEQVVTALNVESRLEAGLTAVDARLNDSLAEVLNVPERARFLFSRFDVPRLADLAAPMAEPIDLAIEEGVDGLVRSDAFRETLPVAVAYAHKGAVALVREDTESLANVSVVDGEVRWYLLPTVADALAHLVEVGSLPPFLESLRVPDVGYGDPRGAAVLGNALGTILPEGFGEVTIMSAETLEGWQSIARSLDRVVYAAISITLVLVLTVFVISPDRRRTLVQIAFGSALAVLVAWLLQRNVIASVDAAIGGPSQRAAAGVLIEAVFASLRNVSRTYIVLAGIVGVTAHVAGRPRWLAALGRTWQRDREQPWSEPIRG